MPETLSFAENYIKNVPWMGNLGNAFAETESTYMDAFKNILTGIPIEGDLIDFDEDIWNFNPYLTTATIANRIRFTQVPLSIRKECKFFVLHSIMGTRKISTINARIENFSATINKILESSQHKDFGLITTKDIINNVNSRNLAPSTAHSIYVSIIQIYRFLITNYNFNVDVNLDILEKESLKMKKAEKNERDDRKVPDIPDKYFDIIISKCIEIMRNEKETFSSRVTASSLIVLSQTGLRTQDLLNLKKNNLIETKLPKSGETVHFIHYESIKPSKAHSPILKFDIFSNSLCTEAFRTLINLDEHLLHDKTSYLIRYKYNCDKYPHLETAPVERRRFVRNIRKFFWEHLNEAVRIPWENIPVSNTKSFLLKKHEENCNIYVPEIRQFRVHLCTTLYNKGTPLVYIQKYMGHLSEAMLGYYVRPKDTYQENIKYSEKVIQKIVGEKLTPIGTLGEEMKQNIIDFVEQNAEGIDVYSDAENILKIFGDKLIIRGKPGGCCIKTSLMPCSQDARTNELMCAYNICPNLFHFFYMIDISYSNFKTLQDTYNLNKKNQKKLAAQKELNKIKHIIRNRILPELEELDKEILKKGKTSIINSYPSLLDIIENEKEIKKEVQEWMNK